MRGNMSDNKTVGNIRLPNICACALRPSDPGRLHRLPSGRTGRRPPGRAERQKAVED